jgi:hypothetical protein
LRRVHCTSLIYGARHAASTTTWAVPACARCLSIGLTTPMATSSRTAKVAAGLPALGVHVCAQILLRLWNMEGIWNRFIGKLSNSIFFFLLVSSAEGQIVSPSHYIKSHNFVTIVTPICPSFLPHLPPAHSHAFWHAAVQQRHVTLHTHLQA